MLGNQIGVVYMKRDRIRSNIGDKYGFFLLTKLVPARILKTLIRGEARVTIDLT